MSSLHTYYVDANLKIDIHKNNMAYEAIHELTHKLRVNVTTLHKQAPSISRATAR